jgi:hypothetical protein
MAKICECDIIKKENKLLTSQFMALERKSLVIDEHKMEHMLQLKHMVLETELLKVQKLEQTKVLKDQTNHQEHKRKLETIQFTAKARQKGKDKDAKRRHCAKQKKFQGGSDQMSLLLGKIRKQNELNGGKVPTPGTTPITGVSLQQLRNIC